MPYPRYKTHKDWRHREWPAGINVKKNKKLARKKTRRFINKSDELPQGNSYRKIFEHYEINDFK